LGFCLLPYVLNEPSGATSSNACSIVFANDTVYTAGRYTNSGDVILPLYWRDNTPMDLYLPAGASVGQAWAITFNESVYNAGVYFTDANPNKAQAVYWKGSTATVLPNLSGATASYPYAITVEGGTVYTAGVSSGITPGISAVYWKNNSAPIALEKPSGVTVTYATSIAIINDSVYISGAFYKDSFWHPCYWKDGVLAAQYIMDTGNDFNMSGYEPYLTSLNGCSFMVFE